MKRMKEKEEEEEEVEEEEKEEKEQEEEEEEEQRDTKKRACGKTEVILEWCAHKPRMEGLPEAGGSRRDPSESVLLKT